MRYQTLRRAVMAMLVLSVLGATLLITSPAIEQRQVSAFIFLPEIDQAKTAAKPADGKRQTPAPCKTQPERKTGVRDPFKQLLRGIML